MYEIRSESIKSFIDDFNIKLPRFQRKRTWDEKKNFQLCISIFKEYPIGVTILNNERNGSLTTRWLLDGRQRRTALTELYKDPENIYFWAKKFIGFKTNDSYEELETQFWKKIKIYLEDNEIENNYEDEENNYEDERDNSFGNKIFNLSTSLGNKTGLDLLLYIIKLIHNNKVKTSGFTEPFDFTSIISKLPYEIEKNGKITLSSQKLKSFIIEYKNYCLNELFSYHIKESFIQFMSYRFELEDRKFKMLINKIDTSWNNIIEIISMIDKIDNLFMLSKIALIEVSNLNSIDSQKIFNIINSEGTKLTAVEILSAKPTWNILINNPNNLQIERVKFLYKRIEIEQNDIVKWDLAATFISRLENYSLFFKNFTNSKSDLSTEITLGFKFLSGYFENGITKDDIDLLGKNEKIDWNQDYEILIRELNTLIKIITNTSYFKYLLSWNFSISTNLGDSIALNFLLIMYKDWKLKGSPIENTKESLKVGRNSMVLLDQLIYEYITKQWKGSSDSKIAQNLSSLFQDIGDRREINIERWEDLITDIITTDSIQGNSLTQKMVVPILYHFYALSKIKGPGVDYTIDIDHIIPQSIFKSSNLENKDSMLNNLFNLALLPRGENISKANKPLNEIKSRWLVEQIENYAFISEEDFNHFSEINNIEDLRKRRGSIFLNTFFKNRKEFFSINSSNI